MERQQRENKVRVLQNIENMREYIPENVFFFKLRVGTDHKLVLSLAPVDHKLDWPLAPVDS